MAFAFLSYYVASDHEKSASNNFSGFKLYLVISLLYLIFWYFFSPKKIARIHILLMGLLYIGTPPLFENDQYRYIWEGKVLLSGENPYKLAPNRKELNHIKFPERKNIAYNKLTSIYPPLAQLYFLIAAPFPYQYGLMLMQLLCLLLVFYLITNLDFLNDKYLLLILPYLFKEFVQSVHLDIVAATLLVFCIQYKKDYLGIILSYFVKFLSLLALPFYLIRDYKNKKKISAQIFLWMILLFMTYYFYPTNSDNISGAEAFIQYWKWNSLNASILSMVGLSSFASRVVLLCSFGLLYSLLLLKFIKSDKQNIQIHLSTVFMGLIFFSPVVHPWYAIWGLVLWPGNRSYYFFLWTTLFAYSFYGFSELKLLSELIQWFVLALAIVENFKKSYTLAELKTINNYNH